MLTDDRDRIVGGLKYRTCGLCRTGRVEHIWITGPLQGRGMGREALQAAVASAPGYTWATSRQSTQGRAFFAAMSEELEMPFARNTARCGHDPGRAS
ncbi:hypothetical protein [Streptomyces jeddahensis]|uniref:hypothetical protein n=1 Tax=Streptomyces jeddahensis TaxID=1716141 RepID=UPI00083477DC|nr:hypothetical protein [Streptomyces jeddahensis]